MGRPIWKGSISFGLVNIPIQLETAVREQTIHFHMLSKDGSCRLRRKLYCPETGKEFEFGDTARGIEVSKDQYVVVDEKELEALKPDKGRAIEIEQFVELEEIDPVYFDRVYFVTPGDNSAKAYRLLYEAMKETNRVGLAKFVMRDKEYVAAIRVMGDGIVLHTVHFPDEVLSLEDALPGTLGKAKPAAGELQVARQLIDAMTTPLDLSAYKDTYRQKVEDLIDRKKKGKKTVAVADDHDDEPLPRTINLMDALKRSLHGTRPPRAAGRTTGRHPRRRSA
jgi:DNA end-binding protein Ku